jgi:hypothetical protein
MEIYGETPLKIDFGIKNERQDCKIGLGGTYGREVGEWGKQR